MSSLDCGKPFGKDFAVASVRAEDPVVGVEQISLTNCGRLLTDRKMCWSRMTVFNSVIFARRLDAVDHHFEFADDKHISVNPQEILCGKVFLFFLDRFLILVHRGILIFDPAAFSYCLFINKL